MLYTKNAKEYVLQLYLGQFMNHKHVSRPLKLNFTKKGFWELQKINFYWKKLHSLVANLNKDDKISLNFTLIIMICQLDPVSDLELVKFEFLDNHGHKLLELAGNYASFQQFSISLRLDFST